MRILSIDTSAGAAVAVVEGESPEQARVLSRAVNPHPREHAESLTGLIERALTDAGLDKRAAHAGLGAIVVGTGPAPFTGLRAGLVSGRALSYSCSIPLYGLSSLETLARGYLDQLPPGAEVAVVTDARRREVYWARYRALGPHDVTPVEEPTVSAPASVANRAGEAGVFFAGPGCAVYPEVFASNLGTAGVDAALAGRLLLARLQRGVTGLPSEPLYLRRPDIHGAPKSGAAQ